MSGSVAITKAVGPVTRLFNHLFVTPSRNMSEKINFNSKHLGKGDPLPAYNGKLRLYNMRYCPYAQRTVLALNAKKIDYEIVNINLYEKPEWLTSKSAFGKVPALEIKDGVSIYESLITVEYLDDAYPQRPLLPQDPVRKAFDKILVEACGSLASLFIKLIKTPDAVNEDVIAGYFKTLDFLQENLKTRGTKFFHGDQPGYVDYMNWPWFERLLPISETDKRLQMDTQKYKLLVEYLDNIRKDPVVAEYIVPEEILLKFLEPYKTGSPVNYELMTE